jgi:hypothetical protein
MAAAIATSSQEEEEEYKKPLSPKEIIQGLCEFIAFHETYNEYIISCAVDITILTTANVKILELPTDFTVDDVIYELSACISRSRKFFRASYGIRHDTIRIEKSCLFAVELLKHKWNKYSSPESSLDLVNALLSLTEYTFESASPTIRKKLLHGLPHMPMYAPTIFPLYILASLMLDSDAPFIHPLVCIEAYHRLPSDLGHPLTLRFSQFLSYHAPRPSPVVMWFKCHVVDTIWDFLHHRLPGLGLSDKQQRSLSKEKQRSLQNIFVWKFITRVLFPEVIKQACIKFKDELLYDNTEKHARRTELSKKRFFTKSAMRIIYQKVLQSSGYSVVYHQALSKLAVNK